jgi:hypothetical protein
MTVDFLSFLGVVKELGDSVRCSRDECCCCAWVGFVRKTIGVGL